MHKCDFSYSDLYSRHTWMYNVRILLHKHKVHLTNGNVVLGWHAECFVKSSSWFKADHYILGGPITTYILHTMALHNIIPGKHDIFIPDWEYFHPLLKNQKDKLGWFHFVYIWSFSLIYLGPDHLLSLLIQNMRNNICGLLKSRTYVCSLLHR